MPVDPALTSFRLPTIMTVMPRIFRAPTANIGGATPPPSTGQLWPRKG